MKVDYIDHMGTDLTVVNAARVSFDKTSDWEYPGEELGPDHFKKELSERDQKLIKYLANHNHFTPFTHVQITMREKVPIFVARQRFKHVIGFSYNEVSRRYVDDTPEFYTPDLWRKRADNKKQGSSDEVVKPNEKVFVVEKNFTTDEVHEKEVGHLKTTFTNNCFQKIDMHYDGLIDTCTKYYQFLLDSGVAPEQARMVLPQSMYTEYYVTGSLAAWARAYKLRIDPHAQKEIQELAAMWNEVISGIDELRHSWKALTQ